MHVNLHQFHREFGSSTDKCVRAACKPAKSGRMRNKSRNGRSVSSRSVSSRSVSSRSVASRTAKRHSETCFTCLRQNRFERHKEIQRVSDKPHEVSGPEMRPLSGRPPQPTWSRWNGTLGSWKFSANVSMPTQSTLRCTSTSKASQLRGSWGPGIFCAKVAPSLGPNEIKWRLKFQ